MREGEIEREREGERERVHYVTVTGVQGRGGCQREERWPAVASSSQSLDKLIM